MNIFNTLLNPRSIAVIGASRSPQKVGHQIVSNIIKGGFKGNIFPVNPNAKKILSLNVYPTVSSCPQVPEMIVVTVPAPLVETVIAEADSIGVKAAIIITAGFAESGPAGKTIQAKLGSKLRPGGIRVLGPNCLGVLSPSRFLNATFGPSLPKKGHVMLISQSGALVTGILDWINQTGLGLSHAITLGNRLDIDENEALEFASKDTSTKVIMVYLESFKDAPRFFSQASKISPVKPIILLVGGQSKAGQTASASHTAALATDFVLIKALSRQTGVILAKNIEEWLNFATIFATTKPVEGPNLAIITNAGGPGVLSADNANRLDLEIKPLSGSIKQKLSSVLNLSHYSNPLDILGDATPQSFYSAVKNVTLDWRQDALLIIMTPQTTTQPLESAIAITEAVKQAKMPVFCVLLGGQKLKQAVQYLKRMGIPTFQYPNEAISVIAAKFKYDLLSSQVKTWPSNHPHLVATTVLTNLNKILASGQSVNTFFSILSAYGISLPKYRVIDTLEKVPAALSFVSRPAVMKTGDINLAHKAKVGGVIKDIMSTSQARLAYRKLCSISPHVLVQETIHGQVEVLVGAKKDPQLGTFVVVGLGGSLTNVISDRHYIFLPSPKNTIEAVIKRSKAYEAIREFGFELDPLIDLVYKVSGIMLDLPLEELEINPAIVTKNKAYAVDIKMKPEVGLTSKLSLA